MRRFLVASCLAEVTQQIHSFRASGVISAQRLLAVASDAMARRRSAGTLWTVPWGMVRVVTARFFYVLRIVPGMAQSAQSKAPRKLGRSPAGCYEP
jgi:hypothetical protein